ncbi:tolloid-like protein 1 [Trichonephila clavipes]|nr:tolloid-like protein 1 [Trichonephila clavipes]
MAFSRILSGHTKAFTFQKECDRIFVSNAEGPKNGSFSAPQLNIPKGHSRHCIYTFIASEEERVQVTFMSFNLRGTNPECNHEYIDLYTEIEDASMELIRTPFGGRYCGRNRPRNRISMYQTLVIAFYTDEELVTPDAFEGYYEFINASQYVVGTASPDSVCSFTVFSDNKSEGEFRSPTYPGVYPKNLNCHYRFMGKDGQRVRLEFMDFDLVFGGAHTSKGYTQCRFKLISGPWRRRSTGPLDIGGSKEEHLDPPVPAYIGPSGPLVTHPKRPVDFIGKNQNDGEHIRGTDGDRFNRCQVIYSQFGLAIHQNDHQARRRFVEWVQNEIAVILDFHKRILFSDEAHFWLNGYVNKQNCRIWSEANPQVYVETPLHPEKLTVWCALWAGGILLQKR